MSRRQVVLWGAAGAVAAVFAFFTYARTFPEAALDLKVSRQEAAELARQFVERQGLDLSGYRHADAFHTLDGTRSFLEKKLDLAEANRLMAGEVNVWEWRNRWFIPLQQEEHWVSIAPDGRLMSWTRVLPEDAPGEKLTAADAQRVAEQWLAQNNVPLDGYEIADNQYEELPNRWDYDVSWKLAGFDCHGATQRIWVHVAGNTVTRFYRYLKLPDTWEIEQNRAWSYKSLLQSIASVAHVCLSIAVFVVLAIGLRRGGMRFRFIFVFCVPLAILPALLIANSVPISWLSYDTTDPADTFWAEQAVGMIVSVVGTFMSVAVLLLTADWLARKVWPDRMAISRAHTRSFWRSGPVGAAVFVGLCLAALHLAYVSAFYYAARRAGAWVPQDVPSLNALGTLMPWLMPLATGLSAAFDEEFTFRLFALALFARLTKRLWPGVIISSLIWAFLHSTYPQEPFFIRGLELTVVGIAYSVVALRYGIVATLVSHYTYNAVSTGIALTASGQAYPVVTGLAVMSLGALLLLPAILARRKPQLPLIAEESQPAPQEAPPEPAPLPEPLVAMPVYSYQAYEPLSPRAMRILAALAIVSVAVSAAVPKLTRFGDYVKVTTSKRQVEQMADDYLRGKNIDPAGYKRSVDFADNLDGDPAQYVWEITRSIDAMNETFRVYQPDAVYWEVSYIKPMQREGHTVYFTPDGNTCGYYHSLEPDAPGANLPQDEARTLAENHLRQEYGVNLDQYRLVESDSTEMEARTDHTFEWEHASAKIGECGLRVSAEVQGDEPHAAAWSFHLPEKWTRERDRASTVRILLSLLLFPLPILFFWRLILFYARRQTMPAKPVLLLALIPAAASLLLVFLGLENVWSGYDVDVSPMVHFAQWALAEIGAGTFVFWLFAAFLIVVADAFYRHAFPNLIPPMCWFGLGRRQFNDAHLAQIPALPMRLAGAKRFWPACCACTRYRSIPSLSAPGSAPLATEPAPMPTSRELTPHPGRRSCRL